LLSHKRFKKLLVHALEKSDSLRAAAKTKRVIWVVGDKYENREGWEKALEEAFEEVLGPSECDFKACTIYLTDPIPFQERKRPKNLLA
jgi:hypothetical protein